MFGTIFAERERERERERLETNTLHTFRARARNIKNLFRNFFIKNNIFCENAVIFFENGTRMTRILQINKDFILKKSAKIRSIRVIHVLFINNVSVNDFKFYYLNF